MQPRRFRQACAAPQLTLNGGIVERRRGGFSHAGQYIEPMFSTSRATIAARRWLAVPSLCAVCHGWGPARLCDDCSHHFIDRRVRCQRCAIEVPDGTTVCGACLRLPPAFDRCVAAVDYDYPWDGLILAFKFQSALDLGAVLAAKLNAAIDVAALPAVDWIVPVPLSAERLRERGYNQAWELARRVARDRSAKADARLLLRIKDTPHQVNLRPGKRAANVRDAFLVEPRRAHQVRGAAVAVVDDVITTGSTVEEVARCLKQAGAASVQVWAIARTPKDA
jgi:ComF family protein